MPLPLAILLLAAPPPSDPPFSGVVESVGMPHPYWSEPGVVVALDNTTRRSWRLDRVSVRIAGRPGAWTAETLMAGDRVEGAGPSWYWDDRPTLTITNDRDFDLPAILACERSVVRFAGAGDARPPASLPTPLRAAVISLGSRRFAARERATDLLSSSGRAGVRAAAWAESSADCETRHRAGLAIGRAMRGEVGR